MIKQDHILKFEKFSKFDNLIHGFSTRFFGSMRPSHRKYQESLGKFSAELEIDPQKIVRMNQVHGNIVYFAAEKDCGKTIPKTDGLMTSDKEVFLSVITGDCIPLLFYDPKMKIIAASHAGWKGLYSEIIKETISNFVKKGSKPEDIIVGIGPCIRACCYDVPKERVDQFIAEFPSLKDSIIEQEEKLFFDLPAIAISQLQSVGILWDNIEDVDYCTFDHEDLYSYRREGEDFGEMMGVIGIYD